MHEDTPDPQKERRATGKPGKKGKDQASRANLKILTPQKKGIRGHDAGPRHTTYDTTTRQKNIRKNEVPTPNVRLFL